jgi:hypothetical protein
MIAADAGRREINALGGSGLISSVSSLPCEGLVSDLDHTQFNVERSVK